MVSVVLLSGVIWLSWPVKKSLAPTTPSTTVAAVNVSADVDVPALVEDTIGFSTADLPDRDPAFTFSASIPSTWRVEYVAGSQAINFYDPQASSDSSLDQSVVFIKYYQAESWLTPSTVTIKSQSASTIDGRPAKTYQIEKKVGVANFSSQPAWRNLEHQVTDIRTTDNSPTTFYVVAKAPNLSTVSMENFLLSLTFSNSQ